MNTGVEAGHRAARNTAFLALAEIAGRLAWFAVFAGLGRAQGEDAVGVFVFAAALVQIAMLGVDLGLDRLLIRTVAKERDQRHALTSDVISIKVALVVPVGAVLALLAVALDFDRQTTATILILTAAFLLEGVGRTLIAVLIAHEAGGPAALIAMCQRLVAAALGIGLLLAGYGVVAVATAYLVGSAVSFVVGWWLVRRSIGRVGWVPDPRRWLARVRTSLPFAAEDVFTVLLFKIDAVILAILTTDAIVGLYGAAYRIFEATLVVPYAVVRAFSAMYVYLDHTSEPTIQGAFSRSIKLALACLVPVAVAFGLLADPVLHATFGDDFAEAAGPLRLLAPAVVMLAVISLSCALVTSRRDPKIVMYLTGAVAAFNVVLNLILIPPYEASGAAAAMLASELCFSIVAIGLAARTVGGLPWGRMLGGPSLAGAAMAAVILPLQTAPLAALAGGCVAYLVTLYGAERLLSPGDVRFAAELVRRYLPGRAAA